MERKVHKRIAVTVGMFFLLWLISGIVMILPQPSPAPARQRTPPPLNVEKITMSPAEAIANLAKALGSYPEVNSVNLRQIRDSAVYYITLKSGDSHLINARSGQVFTITPEIAEQIARDEFSAPVRVLQNDLLTRHTFAYRWGPVPAYRIVFDDDRATISYVSMTDGTVSRTDRWGRIRAAMKGIHTFEPVSLISERGAVRKGLLLLVGMLGIGTALSGYYLSLPRRRRVSGHVQAPGTTLERDVSDRMAAALEVDDKDVSPSLQRRK